MKKVIAIVMCIALMSMGFACAQSATSTEYTVTLLENPTTGYTWAFASSDESIVTVTDNGYVADPNPDQADGAGGVHSWVITAKAAGDANVVFTLGQAWDGGEQAATLTYAFQVSADLQLTLTQTRGIPELYTPGQTAVLLLENPTTGFTWQYAASQEGILTPVKDEFITGEEADADKMLVGAGGTHLWTFAGAAEGDVTLTFTYSRSWESVDPEATITYTYHVGSDLRVTCTGVDGDQAQYDPMLSSAE